MSSQLRALPSVDRLLHDARVAALVGEHPRSLVVDAAREALDEARRRLRTGADAPDLPELVALRLSLAAASTLRRAINATGVVIHTNLGRAPLSEVALAAMREVGVGYSNLEYDLEAGARGSRHEHVGALLRRLSGAEAALVVNNNAAAVMLALSALAQGREVVISRGELVEIGGGFRIPDVLRQSGARLVEVGTTNRTYVRDFEAAVTDLTALFLRVHSSNFRVVGFVHAPEPAELAVAAHARGLLLVDDNGSGCFLDTARYGLAPEPLVQESVASGADVVAFSGDKLLGGPQAGILVGRADVIAGLKQHPLTRALRPDKATLAALGATLRHYVRGEAERRVPVWRMIAAGPEEIEARGRAVIRALGPAGDGWTIEDGRSAVGGGSLPGETLPTRLLAAPESLNAEHLAADLRRATPAIVGRIERGRLVFDVRTVLPEEDDLFVRTLGACLRDQAVEVGAPDGSDAGPSADLGADAAPAASSAQSDGTPATSVASARCAS
ncbi:MAG: L-seryl-tRNA(Sec) selenium transferase [Chloroflexota bacterium]|nr:L-seryl-tRNA(Sec) selenium transferase [Chloroflexota bacterium]